MKVLSGHFYLKELDEFNEDDIVHLKGKSYKYFNILDINKNFVDKIDYIYLEDVRLDFEDDVIRIFPIFHYDSVEYDTETHKFTSLV